MLSFEHFNEKNSDFKKENGRQNLKQELKEL